MSRLEELIAELCPNGVEYKTLGELATDIFRGSGITRDQVRKSGIPCVRYGEIYTTYGVWFEECVSFTDESIIPSKKYFEYGDILFAITGEKVEDIAKSCVYIGKQKCLAGGDIVVMKHTQNPKYMGYALSTSSAQAQKSKGKVKSKVVHSSIPSIKEIVIPVPPLPVQEKIVRILDTFTELTAELTAELAKRKQQYQYYRNTLVDFKEGFDRPSPINGLIAELCPNGVGYKNLGEVVSFLNGRAYKQQELLSEGKYKILRVGNFYTNDKWYYSDLELEDDKYCENGDLLFSWAASLGAHIWNEGKTIFHYHIWKLKFDENIISKKYLYYFLNKDIADIQSSVTKSTMVHVSMGSMGKRKIPVPPLPIQEEIVRILDQFEALCNALASELEARKKQYEYYRDKLLTFTEAV